MLDISKDDLNYIAGFFDGEGSIGIYAYYYGSEHPLYKLHTSVANNNRHVLEYIRDTISLNIPCNIKRAGRKTNISSTWQLSWECDQAAKIIEILLPYLKVKYAEAMLGLEFQNRIRGKKTKNQRLSDEEIEIRDELVDKIRLLKVNR